MCNRLSIGLYRRKLYMKHYVIGCGWVGHTFWNMLKYIPQIIFLLVGQMKQHQNPIIHIKRCCVSRVTTITRSCKIYKKLPFLWISSPVLKPIWVPTGSQASLSWQSIIVNFFKKLADRLADYKSDWWTDRWTDIWADWWTKWLNDGLWPDYEKWIKQLIWT